MKNFETVIGDTKKAQEPGAFRGAKYFGLVSRIMGHIHSQMPEYHYDESENAKPIATDIREEYFEGENYKRAVMYLMSNGCEWALKSAHGCTMCGHLAKQAWSEGTISTERHLRQFEKAYNSFDYKEYPIVNIYNNGSITNDTELPPEARKEIYKRIGDTPEIKMVVLETRPEYVTQEKVDEIKALIPDKHVELAIGLEVKDDMIRQLSINKGFKLKQFDRAAALITPKLNLRAYVLLKPAFVTEKEGIEHAVETIEHAFAVGTHTVSMEPCTVQDYTLLRFLKDKDQFNPPWLWSIVDVVKRTAHLGKLIVGMFQFYPSPAEVPYNCDKCSDEVLDAIKLYNRTLDISVFEGLDCDCKDEWRRELEAEAMPMEARLDALKQFTA
jgi:hypothetical protein